MALGVVKPPHHMLLQTQTHTMVKLCPFLMARLWHVCTSVGETQCYIVFFDLSILQFQLSIVSEPNYRHKHSSVV